MQTTNNTKQINMLSEIVTPLLRWYHSQARILPWRENPQPYYVWISEIMLQQTRVEAVKPYFDRFITALPTVQALAEVPEGDLLKLWEGLGYYNRARNLQKAAQQVMQEHTGNLPASYDALLALPGIGRYTAGAIASIAYHIGVPAVDGNVLRVITRLIASREDIMKEKTRKMIEAYLQEIMPTDKAGDFNQALMELGAMVCLPKGAAKCPLCPLKQLCLSHAEDYTTEIPVKTPKKARRPENLTMFRLQYQDKIAFQQRPNKGLLANMWELPHIKGHLSIEEIKNHVANLGLPIQSIQALPPAKHIFTHIEWHMIGYAITLRALPAHSPWHWISHSDRVESFAIPTAFKAYVFEE
jgi:A/G-specific adenine glycosylase